MIALGWEFFLRDFRIHYRPALLGVFWAVAPLLSLAAVFVSLSYGLRMDLQTPEAPYPVFVLAGLIAWQVFTDGLSIPLRMARRTRTVLRCVPFPYAALLVAAVCYALFNLLAKCAVFVLALFIFAAPVPATSPLAVGPLLVLLTFGLALGAVITPLSLVLLDVRYSLSYVIWALFVITPVAYPLPAAGFLRQVNLANPLTYLVGAARDWLVSGVGPLEERYLFLAPVVLLLLLAALRFYQAKIRIGIERIYMRTSASEERLRALLEPAE